MPEDNSIGSKDAGGKGFFHPGDPVVQRLEIIPLDAIGVNNRRPGEKLYGIQIVGRTKCLFQLPAGTGRIFRQKACGNCQTQGQIDFHPLISIPYEPWPGYRPDTHPIAGGRWNGACLCSAIATDAAPKGINIICHQGGLTGPRRSRNPENRGLATQAVD